MNEVHIQNQIKALQDQLDFVRSKCYREFNTVNNRLKSEYGIDMIGKCKDWNTNLCRGIMIQKLRNEGYLVKTICQVMGKRTHSTVCIAGNRAIDRKRKKDERYFKWEQIINQILN